MCSVWQKENVCMKKAILTALGTIGGIFAGVFVAWQIIDYFIDDEYIILSEKMGIYVGVSLIVSIPLVLRILFKDNIVNLDAKKRIESKLGYTPAYHLEYDKIEGKIVNRDGDSQDRQVLLRTDIFNNILDSVYEFSLKNMEDASDKDYVLSYCNGLIRL